MIESIQAILQQTYCSNRILDYLICIGIFLSSAISITLVKVLFLLKLKKLAKKTKTTVDDFIVHLLERLIVPFLYCLGLYAGLKYLILPQAIDKITNILVVAVLTVFGVRLIVQIITYSFTLYWKRTAHNQELDHSLRGILKVATFLIWSLAIIFFLDNLGFKISTVIAGLGIGGVAVALAAQAILQDLFSYFSIIFDRPFEVGDFIDSRFRHLIGIDCSSFHHFFRNVNRGFGFQCKGDGIRGSGVDVMGVAFSIYQFDYCVEGIFLQVSDPYTDNLRLYFLYDSPDEIEG